MHTWQWRSWEGLPYLSCSLLQPWSHGFFSQHFSPRQPAELTKVLHPEAETYRLKQVHGNKVLSPSEIIELVARSSTDGNGEDNTVFAEADGLISESSAQAVWVATADCTPVLIADVKTGQVSAIHAGWRGTAQKIVPQAIARLQARGSKLDDLRIAMGPAISGKVYQVSTQVAAEVGASILPQDEMETIVNALIELPNSPLSPDPEPGKVRLDVRRVNALQLEKMGITTEQVAIAPHCTYLEPEKFFSYRRDNLKKVQWSGIVSG
ncbi:MAG: peptidoglycan editing factor PgeF [Nostocaceae cyanobacterium]|nr:peptidoglycan editing factor PgeF [Nostocaceae cyanobacterium]